MKFVCDECGKKFFRPKNQVRGKHKFCSRMCANKYHAEHRGEYNSVGPNSPTRVKLLNIVAIKKMFGDL